MTEKRMLNGKFGHHGPTTWPAPPPVLHLNTGRPWGSMTEKRMLNGKFGHHVPTTGDLFPSAYTEPSVSTATQMSRPAQMPLTALPGLSSLWDTAGTNFRLDARVLP